MQGLDDLLHIDDLAIVGFEGEIHIDPPNLVDRHFPRASDRLGTVLSGEGTGILEETQYFFSTNGMEDRYEGSW